ncbi:MAG TPA: alpha-ketoglutarate-dependent dioxygenase AlkB [Urbifossiella sp.]|jgi:alkylated DNA repair dioxygenase AlkB|nr:alpha-ketoglutarate-dependent dioxygenase AlkB [Urbifossiella sp.]
MTPAPAPQPLDLPDGAADFYPGFFGPAEADRLLQMLLETTAWRQDGTTIYGRLVQLPRLTAWYGDEGTGYRYSGIDNVPLPWTPALLGVKRAVEPVCGVNFNSVLLNRYRTGQDSVGWHSDDEAAFGENPVIGSVSFGGTRAFQFRHKTRKAEKRSIDLTHGSLLVMRGATQHTWLHQIPKTAKDVPERLNLTFRVIVTPAPADA